MDRQGHSSVRTGPLGHSLNAAYREMAGGEYTVIWPPGSAERFAVE